MNREERCKPEPNPMNDLVTIITLTYNSMGTIFDAINSILRQDYEAIQMIIADDHSDNFDKDAIIDYIEKHKKDNIKSYKVYQNSENLGTVKNINRAIKASDGGIIINLSADDMFYNKDVVSIVVNEFNKTGCNVLCTLRAVFKDSPDNVIGYMPNAYERKRIEKFKTPMQEYAAFFTGRFYNMASGSALSYRKAYIDEIGYFDETYRLWEDGPFFAKSILKDGMLHCNYNIISILYRLGGISTGTVPKALHDDVLKFLKAGRNDPKIKGMNKRILKLLCFRREFKGNKLIRRMISSIRFFDVYVFLICDKIKTYFCKKSYKKKI